MLGLMAVKNNILRTIYCARYRAQAVVYVEADNVVNKSLKVESFRYSINDLNNLCIQTI